ncbi:MAG: UxaA family hydrolase [Thermodesulfobacteriota bacterium]
MEKFMGYARPHGRVGTRNYLAIMPTVFCANEVAFQIARQFPNARPILHHQGCAQLKPDVDQVTRTLIGLGTNPNVGGVLLVALGCESVSLAAVYQGLKKRGQEVAHLTIQSLGGMKNSIKKGIDLAAKINKKMKEMKRKPFPLSRLVLGIKCGSSDASSGLVSNPAVGLVADELILQGGTVIFGETTEFLGAEHLLARRADNEEIANKILFIVERMENRVKALGVDMRGAQPTPGNMRGGITTIEEKSLGAICKSGSRPINGVLEYGEMAPQNGLYILDSPGKEAEIMTGLAAAGANIIVFSTGGGAPQGFPLVPVIKVAGNPQKCIAMQEHIDVDASGVLTGTLSLVDVKEKIMTKIIKVSGGQKVQAEKLKYDQTAEIYITGPTV